MKSLIKEKSPKSCGLNFSSILADWEKYYQKIHSLKTDFSDINIPEASDEFSWLICRPKNFFAERAYSGGKQLYDKWKWTDKSLDDVLDMSFGMDGKAKSYIIRIRSNQEADEDLKNLSANQIAKRNINTLCLAERLLLGDFLYWKHKKQIDVKTITLCAGSRYLYGFVPDVSWSEDYDKIGAHSCYDPRYDNDDLRSRQAVS